MILPYTPIPALSDAERRQAGECVPLSLDDSPPSYFVRADQRTDNNETGVMLSVGPTLPITTSGAATYRGILTTTATTATASSSQATSVGLVPLQTRHCFGGHGSTWLDATQMKAELGRAPTLLERPSLLNALAFKCNSKSCFQGQCSLKLAELNVMDLRQTFSTSRLLAGYGDTSHLKKPILNTLASHYDVEKKSFKEVEVDIQNSRGQIEKVGLCVATWAIAVAGAGKSSFEKMRAEAASAAKEGGSAAIAKMRPLGSGALRRSVWSRAEQDYREALPSEIIREGPL